MDAIRMGKAFFFKILQKSFKKGIYLSIFFVYNRERKIIAG